MWHFREVTDDIVSLDIFPERERELRFMMCEALIREDFSDADDVTFFIWYLDTDESESWDRCLDTDRFRLQSECEIFFQGFDLREADSLRRSEAILDNRRSDTLLLHLDIDTELEKCLLDQDRFLLYLIS